MLFKYVVRRKNEPRAKSSRFSAKADYARCLFTADNVYQRKIIFTSCASLQKKTPECKKNVLNGSVYGAGRAGMGVCSFSAVSLFHSAAAGNAISPFGVCVAWGASGCR